MRARRVLSLPMRNWNPDGTNFVLLVAQRFESTYEELKHFDHSQLLLQKSSFWVYLWGIETQRRQVRSNEEGQSFESTYEELKPVSVYVECGFRIQFWVYLWGIETAFRRWEHGKRKEFWVYLWGIETFIYMI
mgnify:FL=1